MRPVEAIAVACAAGLVGCAEGGPEASPDFAVTDSAGVTLVRNAGPDRFLTVTEVSRFGLVDGDPNLLFDRIRALALGAEGTLWISDSHPSIRHYTEEGAYLGAVGGAGQGPGESPRGYSGLWATDSTLLVFAFSGSLQHFASDGTFLGAGPPTSRFIPLGPTPEGWLFFRRLLPSGVTRGRDTRVIHHGPATGSTPDSILALEGDPMVALDVERGSWRHGSFFDGFPSLATDGAGRVFYSHPSDYLVDVYAPDGRLRTRISRAVDLRPYDDELGDEIEDGVRQSLSRVTEERVRGELEAALPVTEPEWIPPIDLVMAARDGSLWVRRSDRHPRPAMMAVARAFGYVQSAWPDDWRADFQFDLFEADGRYRGSVMLSSDFVPMAVTRDRVYGSMRDELEVEYVVVLEVASS